MIGMHTPGPWECCVASDIGPFVARTALSVKSVNRRRAAGRALVCLVAPGDRTTEEDEANAQLIAAAPDLLAACELALAYDRKPMTAAKELRDAIAKAKGGR
jgi:hypothetical protein